MPREHRIDLVPASTRLPRVAAACIAAALLACACDRPIAPAAPPDDPSAASKAPADAPKTGANAEAAPAPPHLALAPLPRPPSDAQITSHAAAAMRDDPALAGAELTVHTDHGVVSLTGTVRSPEQVAEAEARAQAPAGVMRVDSHLSLAPQ